MSKVIIANGKHGADLYGGKTVGEAALKLLKDRHNEGWWYHGDDVDDVIHILHTQDGDEAWAFLRSRRDNEYEYVEEVIIR